MFTDLIDEKINKIIEDANLPYTRKATKEYMNFGFARGLLPKRMKKSLKDKDYVRIRKDI